VTFRFLEMADDVVHASQQRRDVLGVDRGEHGDSKLIAPELAVRVGIDHAVGAKDFRDERRVNIVAKIDGADYLAAMGRIAHEGRGEVRRLGPVYKISADWRERPELKLKPPLSFIHLICEASR